jgi:hypothetical protein
MLLRAALLGPESVHQASANQRQQGEVFTGC